MFLLSWRTWRNNREPIFRCFGLASMCGVLGLLAIETTASFTGVDARFTVVFATQLGLLAALQRGAVTSPAGGSLATAGGRNT
jgi:hypothetical protein